QNSIEYRVPSTELPRLATRYSVLGTRYSLLASAQQRQLQAVPQRLPARRDDVLRAADRAPALLAAGRLDHHARPGGCAEMLVHDAYFIVYQMHVGKLRVVRQQRFADGAVERVDRPVALRGGVHDLVAHAQFDGR